MSSVTAALTVRLDDITTGLPVWPGDRTLRVRSADALQRPVAKNDGYFVFTGTRPREVRVTSDVYHGVTLSPPAEAGVYRAALLPRRSPEGRVFTLDGGAAIGFYGAGRGYALTSSGKTITLIKEDYADLSGLRCLAIAPDGAETPVYLRAGGGRGRYILRDEAVLPSRCRLLPLFTLPCGGAVPVPDGAEVLYVLRGESVQKIYLRSVENCVFASWQCTIDS
ncbi:MAG: hypothetical protein LBR76_02280 [Oscillospiraceae bacterium]|jgi:hypothetical protein|nr:hypothetical protein [Oscillospiraceae bacterium]